MWQNSPLPIIVVSANPTRTLARFKIPDRALTTPVWEILITKGTFSERTWMQRSLLVFWVNSCSHLETYIPTLAHLVFSHWGETLKRVSDSVRVTYLLLAWTETEARSSWHLSFPGLPVILANELSERDIFCFALLLLSRTLCTSYQLQRRIPNTSAYCILVSEPARKIQCSQCRWNRALHIQRRDTSRSASIVSVGSPIANGSLPAADTRQFTYVHPSFISVEELCPLLGQIQQLLLARCHMTHTLKQNKGPYIELATGK